MGIQMKVLSKDVFIVVIYRPPSSSGNNSMNCFMEEFSSLLEDYVVKSGSLLIAGDFNFHIDNSSDVSTTNFIYLLEAFNLRLHATQATHRAGNVLDLIIDRNDDENFVHSVDVHDPMISDHFTLMCSLDIRKPGYERRTISCRNLKLINSDAFRDSIEKSSLLKVDFVDLPQSVELYNSELLSILDFHAPLSTRTVTVRPAAPWYSNEIKIEKRKRRQLERRWRESRLPQDRLRFTEQCRLVNRLLWSSRASYYSQIVNENQSDQRKLFGIVDKLLHAQPDISYPPHSTSSELANCFIKFFVDKINTIHHSLDERCLQDSRLYEDTPVCSCSLDHFVDVPIDDLFSISRPMARKACDLDPIPGSLLITNLDVLMPVITGIVNLSLKSGSMPAKLKEAVLKPLLKKPNLDQTEFKSYRPISNLSFLSKVIEKVVALQLTSYLEDNHLYEPLQSAYKKFHSTETALIKVHNDIATAIDSGHSVILVLLDLSAAFDTVDHTILIRRLSTRFGIRGRALDWFVSYLSDRKQYVKVNNTSSNSLCLTQGVPQGSVLGPILYSLYTSPLGDIAKQHQMNYHFYADDSQLYISFKSCCTNDADRGKILMETCVRDIDLWMVHNRLKLNQDKTEVLVFSSCYRPRPNIGNLAIVDMMVNCSTKAKDIGVTLDNSLSMVPHITAVCKSAFFHLRNISKIRGFLNTETTKTLVHAFVTSKVDYCNSLLYGVPKYLLQRLQRVLNCAARIVFKSNKYDHITPLLRELHWLPIQQRIEFKILLITFKALNKQAPTYLTDLLISYTPSRSLRSSSKNLLKIPMYNLKSYGGRSFALASAVLWNSLPQSLRDLQSVETFKRKLKKHLFLQAYMEH